MRPITSLFLFLTPFIIFFYLVPHPEFALYGVLADSGDGVWSAVPANLVAAGARVPVHCTVATLHSFRASRQHAYREGCACRLLGGANTNQGSQAAPACGHRGVASMLLVDCYSAWQAAITVALGGLGEHGHGLKSQGDDGSFFLEPI